MCQLCSMNKTKAINTRDARRKTQNYILTVKFTCNRFVSDCRKIKQHRYYNMVQFIASNWWTLDFLIVAKFLPTYLPCDDVCLYAALVYMYVYVYCIRWRLIWLCYHHFFVFVCLFFMRCKLVRCYRSNEYSLSLYVENHTFSFFLLFCAMKIHLTMRQAMKCFNRWRRSHDLHERLMIMVIAQ